MAKKVTKNYLKMFVDYAEANEIGYSVFGDRVVDDVTIWDAIGDERAYTAPSGCAIGSKSAYDWLVKCNKEAKAARCPHCGEAL